MMPILTIALIVALALSVGKMADRLGRLEEQGRSVARAAWDDRAELAGRVSVLEALLNARVWELEDEVDDVRETLLRTREAREKLNNDLEN